MTTDLIRLRDVPTIVPLSMTAIRSRIDRRSKYYDSSFPKPRKYGRAVVFIRAELEHWLKNHGS